MITIKEVLQKSAAFLEEKGVPQSRRQAEEVIADSLELARLELYLQFDRPLVNDEVEKCRQALLRRSKGEPCQYIRGRVEFHDCVFDVDSNVLIPRQETEILVGMIMKDLEHCDLQGKVLWDLCTGSGCIGITLKKRFPELQVILSDASESALEMAGRNALKNGVEVDCILGDLLTPFQNRKAHFVVCNPPYIADREFEGLEREVKEFEPKTALVSGTSGLEFYERLSADLPGLLYQNGRVWLEIGTGQGEAVLKLFSGGRWTNARYLPDWSSHDRFFFVEESADCG
jgi:release factor glutamine methyltransferase